MKKILLMGLLAYLLCGKARAQGDSVFVESASSHTFEQMADSCFKHVSLDLVPTGILIEKALPTIAINLFDGVSTDSNEANLFLWRRAYGTLRRANTDTSIAHDTLALYQLTDTMRSYLDSGLIPVAILNMQYNCIKSNAFEDNLLHMEGIELFDVEEREESPYEERTCFIASAATIQSDSTVVDFIFPEHLYITNDTRIVDHLEVEFQEKSGQICLGHWSIV